MTTVAEPHAHLQAVHVDAVPGDVYRDRFRPWLQVRAVGVAVSDCTGQELAVYRHAGRLHVCTLAAWQMLFERVTPLPAPEPPAVPEGDPQPPAKVADYTSRRRY